MVPYSSPACLAVAFLLGLAGLNTLPSCLRAPDFCAAKTANLLAASLDNSSVVTVCLKEVYMGHSRFLSHWQHWCHRVSVAAGAKNLPHNCLTWSLRLGTGHQRVKTGALRKLHRLTASAKHILTRASLARSVPRSPGHSGGICKHKLLTLPVLLADPALRAALAVPDSPFSFPGPRFQDLFWPVGVRYSCSEKKPYCVVISYSVAKACQ